jgi:hypothetical protein
MKNDSAIFYDIHRHPEKQHAIELTLAQFLDSAAKGQLFTSDTAIAPCPDLPAIDGALQLDTSDWVNLEIALVWALTGKLADKETIYPYRDVYRALLKTYKLQNTFRLSVLVAYLICAIRLKRNGWSTEDKNNVDDYKVFCEQLLDPDVPTVTVSAFMCAHREADEEDANKLVKKLKTESFVRIMNIFNSVAHNLTEKTVNFTIFHLDDNRYSLLAIFPNIIFKYLESDGLGVLLRTLGEHYRTIEALTQELSTDRLKVTLKPTGEYIAATRKLCAEVGGENWRQLTPAEAARTVTDSYLHEITEEAAMEEVRRYMPEYGAVKANSVTTAYTHAGDENIMQWYAEQENLTPYAKALYETLFYFNWGKTTKEQDGIAVGIDRDHSDFQVRAFHTGYNSDYQFGSCAPVVYLRRSDRELGKTDIHSLSLRQFWRYSGDNKR